MQLHAPRPPTYFTLSFGNFWRGRLASPLNFLAAQPTHPPGWMYLWRICFTFSVDRRTWSVTYGLCYWTRVCCLVCIGTQTGTMASKKKKETLLFLGMTCKETGDAAPICLPSPESGQVLRVRESRVAWGNAGGMNFDWRSKFDWQIMV